MIKLKKFIERIKLNHVQGEIFLNSYEEEEEKENNSDMKGWI